MILVPHWRKQKEAEKVVKHKIINNAYVIELFQPQ